MSGVSVVHFNTSPHKVLQQSNSNDRREIIILRKTQNTDDILITNTGRKKSTAKKEVRTTPQPIAVARRNARERNRVKQVNNGFANLRQHIPNFIAQAFESNTRGGNKKLSKVETLKMAVEYIRSLEDLLALEETDTSFSSPSSSVPYQADEEGNPSPHYTYQIIPSNLYEDSESIDDQILDSDLAQDLLNNMHASDSLSPGMYSEQSLSPGGNVVEIKTENIPVISLKTEDLSQHHKNNVIDVMQWWEQQQSPH